MDSREHSNASVASAARVIRRRFALIALCALIVPAAALGLSLLQEKQYTASASLLFRDPGLDQKLFGSSFIEPSRDPDREAATNVRLVSLKAVAARTAGKLPGTRLDAEDVAAKIDVAAEEGSDVLAVEATDRDPRFAARLANAFAEQYIQFRRSADRAKVQEALGLIERQVTDLPRSERNGSRGRSLRERGEELQVLASLQTGNAELVQRADEPKTPSSPKPVRNTAVGLALGLLLGVALAFLLERLDRRLRDPKEIEAMFERPILGAIPNSRALARERAAGSGRLPAAESESFRMLRANLRYFNVDRDVQTVLVTSAAPGDGKSTVAWNLATAAAGAGTRALLIEADLRHPSLARGLGVDHTVGLSTVLAGERELRDVVQQVPVPTRQNGRASMRTVDVVFAGPLPPNPTDLIESDRMREVVKRAEQDYEFVVIDTPPTSVVSDAIPLVNQVGGVIVVGRLGKSTRESVLHLRNQLRNLDAPTLGVVVNAIGGDTGSYGYGYGYGYGYAETGEAQTEPSTDDGRSARGLFRRSRS